MALHNRRSEALHDPVQDDALASPPEAAPAPRTRPVWHGFLVTPDERRRIDRMLAAALFDPQLCTKLVSEHDMTVMAAYGLSLETQRWLSGIEADSLQAFATEITYPPSG